MSLPLFVHASLLLMPVGRVVWEAPASCPSASAVQERIAELTATADAEDVAVEAIVREREDVFVVALAVDVDERRFTRELEAPRCEALAEAVALVVATTADPLASAAVVRETVASPPTPAVAPSLVPEDPVAVVPSAIEPAPRARTRSRPPIDLLLGVGGGVEAGALPGPTGSAAGLVALERDRLRIEIGGMYLVRRPARLNARRGATVELGAASLRGCGRLGVTRLFVLCLGAEGGAMRGDPFGIADGRARTEVWAAGLASVAVHGAVSRRVRLFARGEVAIAFVQPRFELRPPGLEVVPVHDPGPVSARVVAGIEIAFSVTKARPPRE